MAQDGQLDWSTCRFVVFDVDGTLYSQGRLRRYILPQLALAALRSGDRRLLAIIKVLREEREALAEAETEDFETALIARTAERCGCPPERARQVLREWLEERPLPMLRRCLVPGAPELFEAIRRSGRAIGILSDYPAREKLAAMGLSADHVVGASDPEVGVQKPSVVGFSRLMTLAGQDPAHTVLIGDRQERDGEVAARLRTRCLIRAKRGGGPHTFADFRDPIFQPLLREGTAQ